MRLWSLLRQEEEAPLKEERRLSLGPADEEGAWSMGEKNGGQHRNEIWAR